MTINAEDVIILKRHYDKKGKYLGAEAVWKKDLTPEFLEAIKNDKDNKMGWKKHRKVMKEKGYDID